ncbi:heavy metal-associated isoprenylated plant protein 32-like [Salvia splendens]|uniref:heavy metal-associated isoprenylated plant protein 32-like n=1 Tax=Salvia splendens TaxID=180675 RepID=UPI001C27A8D8|nr:heavy metal-associated isoprenylated plant protein 32-like [Salvia splendens]
MSKQDMLKVQTCVLRVNIHCEGCMHKVKKKLQKVDGVYKVSIDAEQGKVMVSGNADPASLIEKLEKAGKHAELWGPQKGGGAMPFQISQEQLKKLQLDNFNKNNQKKGNDHHSQMKNGFVELPFKKGGEKAPAKEQKAVRFELPEDEDDFDDDDYDDDDDDYSDDFDEDEDDFEDEFEDVKHSKPLKGGEKPSKGDKLDKGGGGGKEGKKAKKGGGGGGIDMFFKGMLSKAAGGKKGKSDKKGESKKKDGGGKKGGGFELGDAKKGKKDDDGWSKKGGDNFHGGKQQQHGFGEMKANHKGGGGGGGGGRNMEMMGGFPAVAGMPAMNGSRFPGAGQGNPYSQQQQQQQQYIAQMMMMNQMNQQREHGHEAAYHPMANARLPPPAHMGYGQMQPMGYGGPPPMHPMGYGPPQPATGEYAHMFSDENTDSCSIM